MRRELPDAGRIEQALARVYERPELTPPAPSPLRAWFAEFAERIVRWIGDLLSALRLGEGELRFVGWLVAGVLVGVAVLALLRLAGVLRASWRGRAPRGPRHGPVGARDGADSVSAWERRAREAAAVGQWREASFALYRVLLLRLEERGALRYDAAKTPGDYRRDVRGDPPIAGLLERFLRVFEPAAFGTRPPDGAVVERLANLLDEAVARG